MPAATFTSFAPVLGAAAAAGSVATLLWLHRLRPERDATPVATLVFVRQAFAPAKARVLGGPLSRRWTLLLLCTICGLIALAMMLADRHRTSSARTPAAFVIDDGCELATPEQGRSAWDVLRNRVATELVGLGDEQGPAVILAGADPVMLSEPGTPAAVSADRLGQVRPGAAPARPGAALLLAQSLSAAHVGPIVWYTTAASLPAELPVAIAQRVIRRYVPPPPRAVLSTVLFVPDPTDPSHGTLRAAVSGNEGATATKLLFRRLDDQQDAPEAVVLRSSTSITPVGGNWTAQASIPAVAADGSSWSVRLADAPGDEVEQSAVIRLPRCIAPEFQFSPATPPALREAIRAAFSGSAGPSSGDKAPRVTVAIGPETPNAPSGICIVPDARTNRRALPLASRSGESDRLEHASVSAFTGLPSVSRAVPLLQCGGVSLAAYVPGSSTSQPGAVLLSASLFDDRSDLTRRAAFALFIQTVCRQLGLLSDEAPVLLAGREAVDPIWAGAQRDPNVSTVFAPPPAVSGAAGASDQSSGKAGFASLSTAEWLLALALGLMTAEAVLFARRKVV